MKRWLGSLWVVMLLGFLVGARGEEMNIKAGPTEPGERLALAWVEALVGPKVVKEERTISLGVRTTAKVKAVSAAFDFTSERLALNSVDGMNWGGSCKIAESVSPGVHVVRYQIVNDQGSIQRTLDFLVEDASQATAAAQEAEIPSSWPLTVISTCTAFSGRSARILTAGEKITGLSKVLWYRILLANGEEGWVPAAQVKEPTEEYYQEGYRAYQEGNFSAAIESYRKAAAVNPDFVKAYIWLAKSYLAQKDLDSAFQSLQKALRLDGRNLDSRILAGVLAQKYFSIGHNRFKAQRYHEAIAAFRKAVELKPNSLLSWLEIGKCFSGLGLGEEARGAWREALKIDPENQVLLALVKTVSSSEAASFPAVKRREEIVPAIADDSLEILKQERTGRGTKIEAAIKSVLAMTKSLGTPVVEKGWQVRKQGEKFLVRYLCEQSGRALESFDWLVDVDTRQVLPHNDNSRLLMSRW